MLVETGMKAAECIHRRDLGGIALIVLFLARFRLTIVNGVAITAGGDEVLLAVLTLLPWGYGLWSGLGMA